MHSSLILSMLVSCLTVSASPISISEWLRPTRRENNFIDYATRVTSNTECDCDLSGLAPPAAPTSLGSPSSDLSLAHIAVGRGTQNYTCSATNSSAPPTPIGALASLFNVTCLAAVAPALVAILPTIALDFPVPEITSSAAQGYFDLSGHHYFLNDTTAFFNLDTSAHDYGTGAMKKANSSAAPAGSMVGVDNEGTGAVAWVKLNGIENEQVFQEVFRVDTAGGNPPATCEGLLGQDIEVQYAAIYWLYT